MPLSFETIPAACTRCQALFPPRTGSGATGYGFTPDMLPVCYSCCADDDLAVLRSSDRWTAYLAPQRDAIIGTIWTVSNWPGSLKMPAFNVRRSRAACFGRSIDREDFDFIGPDGSIWHGIVRGDMTLARCRRTKATVPASRFVRL